MEIDISLTLIVKTMVNAPNGSIARAYRSTKRSRALQDGSDQVKVKEEERSRSSSPLRPAQFASSFVDSFRYTAPPTRVKLQRPLNAGIGGIAVKKEDDELVGVPDYVKEDVDGT